MSNSKKISGKICPCCGQDILVPNEITSVALKASYRLILYKLYRAMPETVSREMLAPHSSSASLRCVISRIREALRDEGSEYTIEADYNVGFYLNYKRRKAA